MKIAQICYLYDPAVGGVESHVKNLSENLAKHGHNVVVCTSDCVSWSLQDRVKNQTETANDVTIVRFRGINMTGLFWFILRSRFDLIHVHSFPSRHYTVAWFASKLLRIPLVVTGHYSPTDVEAQKKIVLYRTYLWMRYSLKSVHKLICIVDSEKKAFQKVFGVSEEKIAVIPNGIALREFDDISENEVKSFVNKYDLNGKKIILCLARLTYLKGIDLLVNAFGDVAGKNRDISLVIMGPKEISSYYDALKQSIRTNEIESQVLLMGRTSERTEVLAALKACDLLVLPSRGEVFGIVLIEAMYCKKIVLASDSGGIPDVIEHGRNGFLFKSQDVLELSKKIDSILKCDDWKLSIIRDNAFQNVVSNYNWGKLVEKLIEAYRINRTLQSA
jgi:glycosyltransferase involved in cell wall biosynthesis